MSAIRFENVFQSFGELVVFRDFNMEVQRGETKVVLGEGGSGKTTLLRMVLGLVQPDLGRVFVDDLMVQHALDYRPPDTLPR